MNDNYLEPLKEVWLQEVEMPDDLNKEERKEYEDWLSSLEVSHEHD